MKIAVIQASSQISKNELLFKYTKKYAKNAEVFNFGCTEKEIDSYSYIEISILVGLLLNSKAVDFVVTGCSSGQGMMLACNSMPGVICGYAPLPKDAYLFAQINNGNAVSLPLGQEYTYLGEENLKQTLKMLFLEPFGQGYPKSESKRKQQDTLVLKKMRGDLQKEADFLIEWIDPVLLTKILKKKDVIEFIFNCPKESNIKNWLKLNYKM